MERESNDGASESRRRRRTHEMPVGRKEGKGRRRRRRRRAAQLGSMLIFREGDQAVGLRRRQTSVSSNEDDDAPFVRGLERVQQLVVYNYSYLSWNILVH